ncbi:IS110 family transposase [Nonomuraea sp. bgisy101]|uniref:IS110 family transposase n=1 Tax=Nonomuraea sp. bgisy101 TaxID=3413784 RepID=UPI003D72E8D3
MGHLGGGTKGQSDVSVFCGIDWAEGHHDIALVDQDGQLVAKRRISETIEGFAELVEMLAAAGDTAEAPIPVAIETPRGLLVATLRATGRRVYSINPMAVARYRERYSVARKKSDHIDAMVLANILRTDAHAHRALPEDSELVRAIAVLARAHQDATWRRTRISNELRSLLREYYPTFLEIVRGQSSGLTSREARAVLKIAPTPTLAAALPRAQIATALRQSGRRRRVEDLADEIHHALHQPQLRQPHLVEQAMGEQALALLAVLDAECTNVERLGETVTQAFHQHPDHAVILSFPGLGDMLGARLLAEIGDDRDRFADARAIKAYAGSAPITRASGKSILITHRKVKNNRLAATGFSWAFMALTNHPPARGHYQQRRGTGDGHPAALRHLFNRMLGQLYHCLQTSQKYDPGKAFPTLFSSAA